MSMNDSKIRLLISSALDASGIKATKGQLDELSGKLQSVSKVGADAGDKIADRIGGLPGPLGKLQKAFGGLIGKASMLAGAFTTGWEIGCKIRDQLAEMWPWYNKYINGTDDWAESQKHLKKALAESAKEFDRAREAEAAYTKNFNAAADASIKKVVAMADAFRAAQKAKNDFYGATESAEMQRLQRERFEDVSNLQRAGEFEAAEQVSAAWDIIEAELKAKQQIAAFDRESAAMTKERVINEGNAEKIEEKLIQAEKDLEAKRGRASQLERDVFKNGMWTMTQEEYAREKSIRANDIAEAKANLKKAEEEATKFVEKSNQARAAEITRGIQRGTLVDQLALDADRARLAYDNITEANGNAAGLQWADDYAQKVYDASMESYAQLVEVNKNTENLADKLDELLQIKGGR